MTPITERLPDEPLFRYFPSAYRADPSRILADDLPNGVKVDYAQFLTDVLCLRQKVRQQLPKQMFDARGIINQQRPYIFVMATDCYDFLVATYAALAVGAAIAPICGFGTRAKT